MRVNLEEGFPNAIQLVISESLCYNQKLDYESLSFNCSRCPFARNCPYNPPLKHRRKQLKRTSSLKFVVEEIDQERPSKPQLFRFELLNLVKDTTEQTSIIPGVDSIKDPIPLPDQQNVDSDVSEEKSFLESLTASK
eukprot:Gb_17275 [translate_table: standard]